MSRRRTTSPERRDQGADQAKLRGCQLGVARAGADRVADRIEVQVADAGAGRGLAPQQRLQAGDELGELEGLRQVVVPACTEAGDTVDRRVPRRQKQDR